MKDYMIRGINKNKSMRFFVASTTKMVDQARKIHNTSPVASATLGRMLTANALMSQDMKNEDDSLTLIIKGDGPIGNVVTVGNNRGEVKGYVDNPYVDLENREDGKLNVGGAVGQDGYLTVIKDLGLKDPYTGQTPIVTGEIAEDLANYYYVSEQQPSAISLGVLVERDLTIRAAGGYMIQLLPNVEEEEIEALEEILKAAKPISTMIDEGMTPEDIASDIFKDLEFEVLAKEELLFKCNCSRERMERALISLGKEEIESLIEEGQAELGCHFCNEKHVFTTDDLKEMIK